MKAAPSGDAEASCCTATAVARAVIEAVDAEGTPLHETLLKMAILDVADARVGVDRLEQALGGRLKKKRSAEVIQFAGPPTRQVLGGVALELVRRLLRGLDDLDVWSDVLRCGDPAQISSRLNAAAEELAEPVCQNTINLPESTRELLAIYAAQQAPETAGQKRTAGISLVKAAARLLEIGYRLDLGGSVVIPQEPAASFRLTVPALLYARLKQTADEIGQPLYQVVHNRLRLALLYEQGL